MSTKLWSTAPNGSLRTTLPLLPGINHSPRLSATFITSESGKIYPSGHTQVSWSSGDKYRPKIFHSSLDNTSPFPSQKSNYPFPSCPANPPRSDLSTNNTLTGPSHLILNLRFIFHLSSSFTHQILTSSTHFVNHSIIFLHLTIQLIVVPGLYLETSA